jgi:ATP-dependent helicase HrpB
MTRLETVRVSKASADQRRGRAGRTAPGVCYRLWLEHDSHQLLDRTPPEILHADLTPLALDLAAAGVKDPDDLAWLDQPPPASFAHALELLRELEAIDESGRNHQDTAKRWPRFPCTRDSRTCCCDRATTGRTRLACEVAALLEERDIAVSRPEPLDVDLALRVEAVRGSRSPLIDVDGRAGTACARKRTDSRDSCAPARPCPTIQRSSVLLLHWRIPTASRTRRPGPPAARIVMRNGRGAELTGAQTLSTSPHLVVAQLDDRRRKAGSFSPPRFPWTTSANDSRPDRDRACRRAGR